jgi:hypothetical protein
MAAEPLHKRPTEVSADATRSIIGCSSAAELKIKAAVLVHHGSKDTRLVEGWPAYEEALKANKVTYEG